MKRSKRAKPSNHENGVDFISNMPDPILQLILQGLPTTEEVVRTSILSKRWRYLWTSIPHFPEFPDGMCFPALRFLELNNVVIAKLDRVERFSTICSLLEKLCLIDCFITYYKLGDALFISCPKLKTLRIHDQQKKGFCGSGISAFGLKVSCPEMKKVSSQLGDTICELLAGLAHVESMSLNHFIIRVKTLFSLCTVLPFMSFICNTINVNGERSSYNYMLPDVVSFVWVIDIDRACAFTARMGGTRSTRNLLSMLTFLRILSFRYILNIRHAKSTYRRLKNETIVTGKPIPVDHACVFYSSEAKLIHRFTFIWSLHSNQENKCCRLMRLLHTGYDVQIRSFLQWIGNISISQLLTYASLRRNAMGLQLAIPTERYEVQLL
ncbi:F-box domain, FBD domain, Leucine-rich repeat domain, L domain-like protein [Artemisia annua]|uniref:F-box domain, FBD domain, Leucine-rich repeat domain, L domain-like protein n=1 Tax=Artemisia annua TaxID=35608 RepID=A0A2U1L6M3_ARTAN|nr:F-box domain, FBD domain, Leucine-rich repeat domain, L domain-like protein [Artemisia annua]